MQFLIIQELQEGKKHKFVRPSLQVVIAVAIQEQVRAYLEEKWYTYRRI